MTCETFEKHVSLKQKENLLSERQLKAAALYLHEIGGIIYFDQKATTKPGSNTRSVVVVHPEWFCRHVGELLLPEEMLEDGGTLIQSDRGSIRTDWFKTCFQHLLLEGVQSDHIICMLERVGLCYRKGTNEIMVPALIKEDDGCLKDWEDEGCQLVIGRSLSTEDYERTAIPITLFRQLQVELAQDTNLPPKMEYCSIFKVGELSFLIQVDANSSNPNDDRIDILVKTVDPTKGGLSQVEGVCEIMEKQQMTLLSLKELLRRRTEEIDYYYDSDFSEGSEDPNVSLDEDEEAEFPDVSSQTVEEIDELDIGSEPAVETNDDIGELLAEDILPVEETGSHAPLLSKVKASIEDESKDHQGLTTEVFRAEIQELISHLSDVIIRDGTDTRSHLHNAVYREGHAIRQHFDEGTKKLLVNAEEMKKQLLAKIQAHYSFSIAEREKSVPRFMILTKKDSSGFWPSVRDTLKGLSRKDYRLYFLCEYQFGDGNLHLVEGQKGLKLSKRTNMNEWWKKAAPWVQWSYYVATDLAKNHAYSVAAGYC
ncbi:unnamed protein product [Calypogeia fissa]